VLDLDCISLTCTDGTCVASSCADLLHNGDETDVDCGGSCPACGFSQNCLQPADCSTGMCGANNRCLYGESCTHVLSVSPGSPNGLYLIDPELDGYEPLWAYCDMTTDRGGWTLVLNYLHLGGTNPQLYNSPDRLPWLVSSALGEDEQGTFSWRHTQTAFLSSLHIDELRFYGTTSAHERVLHFKTDLAGCIDYFATGLGSCAGIQNRYRALEGHTAHLPDAADAFDTDQANQAMTQNPFYTEDLDGQPAYWSVRGDESHWALDHSLTGSAMDTLHRVWIRAVPNHCVDGVLNHSESAIDCGGGFCPDCADGQACTSDLDCVGLCETGVCVTPPNCTAIKIARPAAEDGRYFIDLDGAGGLPAMEAICDMTTDGGGWTLVLNYLHQGGTDPLPVALADGLPVVGSERMGKDESGTRFWGHAGAAVFGALDPVQVRFVARSSAHQRRVDFFTDSEDCIAYFSGDETRSCGDIARRYVELPDHTSSLPGNVDQVLQHDADLFLLTLQPFMALNVASWNVGFGQWNVDEWRGGTDADTLHRVFVRSLPPTCANGVADGDETDVDCGGSCPTRCDAGLACEDHADCLTGFCDQGACTPARNCSGLLWTNPATPSGDYLVDLDADGGLEPVMASCDMQTLGGGWTLALNYLHRGNTSPALAPLSDRLPVRGADVMGPDESGTLSWGHASPALLDQMGVGELRFEGSSSAHPRRIHFATANPVCLAYAMSGQGGCGAIAQDHRTLEGHSAYLPREANYFWADAGDLALTNHPFYSGGMFHWNINYNGRWEVDDYPGNDDAHTLHRVWVRATPDHCDNGQADPGEEGVDCGGWCADTCAPLAAGEPCTAHRQCATGVCADDACSPMPHCSAIKAANPAAPSGDYQIDPDGDGGLSAFFASCDMVADGGGWTLVLDYLHQGGSDPALNVRAGDLPLRGSNILGASEVNTGHWGHAANSLLATLAPTEARFFGLSSGHSRKLHFSTLATRVVDYFTTGLGNCDGIQTTNQVLPGHTAQLPHVVTSFYSDRGDLAMTEFPFYGPYGGTNVHWGVGALGRWEVDDFPNGSQNDTLHRVWVRSCPRLMADDFEDGDLAGWTAVELSPDGPFNWQVVGGWAYDDTNIGGNATPGFCSDRLGGILYWDDPAALDWTDYRFAVDLRSADNDGIGVVFRYQDPDNYYKLDMDNQSCNQTQLIRVADGVEEVVATDGIDHPMGPIFHLEVEVVGSTMSVRLNGRVLFGGELLDAGLSSGTVGFYGWGSQPIEFDNAQVFAACP
jgi:hypothetical protein